MRFLAPLAILPVISFAADPSGSSLWNELRAKREKLGVHQEFQYSRTVTRNGKSQASQRELVLEMSQGKWKETETNGSGSPVRIFDGKDLFFMDEGGDEFVRVKRRARDPEPGPFVYDEKDLNLAKATEVERKSCGIPGNSDQCVLLDIPLVQWAHAAGNFRTRSSVNGDERIALDLENGLALSLHRVEPIADERGGYTVEWSWSVKRISFGGPLAAGLFELPSGPREVKELSPLTAARIRKLLGGKPAPDLDLKDLRGNPVGLSAFRGKTVLLDFWTTWCPPCLADGPALDKLYLRYGKKDLEIVGISVNEDRALVERFLKEHPHEFAIALTTENDMPRAYQVGVLPTYIVIGRDGTVGSVAAGDQGFTELRKLLHKAGLEIE